jgi:hypothetical protein
VAALREKKTSLTRRRNGATKKNTMTDESSYETSFFFDQTDRFFGQRSRL